MDFTYDSLLLLRDVRAVILGWLNIRDLLHFSLACKRYYEYCKEDKVSFPYSIPIFYVLVVERFGYL